MDLQRINKHKQSFDDICHYIEDDNGADKVEVWFARELQIIWVSGFSWLVSFLLSV